MEHIPEKQKDEDEVEVVTQSPLPAKRRLPRRRFFELAGASGLGLVVGGAGGYLARSAALGASSPAQTTVPLRFFNESEAQLVGAMAERIFPADSEGPGASDLHVTT